MHYGQLGACPGSSRVRQDLIIPESLQSWYRRTGVIQLATSRPLSSACFGSKELSAAVFRGKVLG
jgi:hypothetical protein